MCRIGPPHPRVPGLALVTVVSALAAISGACAAAAAGATGAAAARASGAAAPVGLPAAVSCARFTGTGAVFSSARVDVYRATEPGYSGVDDWVCARSGGRALPLGLEPLGTRFAPHLTFAEFTAAGPWLAVVVSSRAGWNPCGTHRGSGCTTYHHELELVRAGGSGSSGSGADSVSSSAGAHVVAVRLSAMRPASGPGTAAVVWAQRHGSGFALDALVARIHRNALESGGGTVAVGAIDPRSIRLRGLRVSYTEHGARRTATLPR